MDSIDDTEEALPAGDPEDGTAFDKGVADILLEEDADDLDETVIETESEDAVTEVTKPEKIEATEEARPATEPTAVESPAEEPVRVEPTPTAESTRVSEPMQEAAPSPAPVPVTAPEAIAPITREELQTRHDDWRKETEELLATKHYVMDDAMADEFETDARVAIPKLMARVELDAVTASVSHMMQILPSIIETTLASRKGADADEGKFFEEWPLLNKPEYRDTIFNLASTYRSVNPRASKDDFNKNVGAQAIVSLGLLEHLAGNGGGASVTEVSEVANPSPHKPVGAGRPAADLASRKTNVFDALAQEAEEEDMDLDVSG